LLLKMSGELMKMNLIKTQASLRKDRNKDYQTKVVRDGHQSSGLAERLNPTIMEKSA